ncbi:MAG: hypothetical protein PHU43_01575 [Candidatus Bipolaricaulis sp.]|nr:hypothetical protein [Candidatus Bipolaricaulis sp.]
MKAGEVLGWIQKHDELQKDRAGLQAGLAERTKEEAKLASAWSQAAQVVSERGDRIGSLRAVGDMEGAAALDADTHGARKAAEAASKALEKHREETKATHERILQLQHDAEALHRGIHSELKGVDELAVLGPIAGRIVDVSKSSAESVERNWEAVKRELDELRPVIAQWQEANASNSQWVSVIAEGRSAFARRCLDEGIGLPAREALGPGKRKR